MILEIVTRCQETITERWEINVSDEDGAAALDDPHFALELLDRGDIEGVENVSVEDEHDRDVVSVESA